MNRREKYPDGYLPKIKYWTQQLDNPQLDRIYILSKLKYFIEAESNRLKIEELDHALDKSLSTRKI